MCPRKKTIHSPLSRPAQPSPPPGACKQSSVGTESLGQESAFSSIAQTTPSPRRQTFCHTLAACVLRSDTRFRRFFAHPPDNFRFFLASFSRDQSYFNFLLASETEIAAVKARAAVVNGSGTKASGLLRLSPRENSPVSKDTQHRQPESPNTSTSPSLSGDTLSEPLTLGR